MRIHLSIIQQFWQEVAPKLVHDWHRYFTSTSKQVYLDDVKKEMQVFLHSAKRVSTFEWVGEIMMGSVGMHGYTRTCSWSLQICTTLLELEQLWIEWLADEVRIEKFFDSIASLQRSLLRQVIQNNIDGLLRAMGECKIVRYKFSTF